MVTVIQTAEPDDCSRFTSDGVGQPKVSDTTGTALLAEQVQFLAVLVVVPPWMAQRDAALLRFILQLVGVGTDFGCARPVAGRSEQVEAVRNAGRHERTDLGQFTLDLIDGLVASGQEAEPTGAGDRGRQGGR